MIACVLMFCLHVCAPCEFLVPTRSEEASAPLGLKSQTFVWCYVSAENQPCLLQERQVILTTEPTLLLYATHFYPGSSFAERFTVVHSVWAVSPKLGGAVKLPLL